MANRDGIPAIEHWHDTAGWVVIFACLAGLWATCLWMDTSVPTLPATARPLGSVVKLGPLLALGLWLCLVEGGSEVWYRLREQSVRLASPWAINWPTDERYKPIDIPKAAADLLHHDEGRAMAWQDDDGQRWNLFFFKWLPGRTAALSVKIHRPEICLPASGFTSDGGVRSQLLEVNGVSLPTRAYRFRDGATSLHVYYCYWDGTVFANTQEMIEEDWTLRGRLLRVWSGRRERGAQTLEVAVWGHQEDAAADADLVEQLQQFVYAKG